MNKRGGGILAYIFWMVVGLIAGCIFAGKYVCKYWCGC